MERKNHLCFSACVGYSWCFRASCAGLLLASVSRKTEFPGSIPLTSKLCMIFFNVGIVSLSVWDVYLRGGGGMGISIERQRVGEFCCFDKEAILIRAIKWNWMCGRSILWSQNLLSERYIVRCKQNVIMSSLKVKATICVLSSEMMTL